LVSQATNTEIKYIISVCGLHVLKLVKFCKMSRKTGSNFWMSNSLAVILNVHISRITR